MLTSLFGLVFADSSFVQMNASVEVSQTQTAEEEVKEGEQPEEPTKK